MKHLLLALTLGCMTLGLLGCQQPSSCATTAPATTTAPAAAATTQEAAPETIVEPMDAYRQKATTQITTQNADEEADKVDKEIEADK